MKELTVFNKEVIPVYTTDTGEKVVVGKELHGCLNLDSNYTTWFKRMCEYGFYDGEDFIPFLEESSGGRKPENHYIKLEMAKHIAMIQRTPQGKEIRTKLIELETNVSSLSPQLQFMINMEMKQKELEKKIDEQAEKVDSVSETINQVKDTIIQRDPDWRKSIHVMIAKIVASQGSEFPDVYQDTYSELETRARCRLGTLADNKRKRLYGAGSTKAEIKKITKLTIIEENVRLKEIYESIVKELVIKYCA